MISDEEKDQVRAASDLVAIVQETVELKPRGHEFWGCCPFHGEKTPSFHIIPATQVWHCFGCGEGGDIITYVQKLDGVDFLDAVRFLARRGGVELHESPKAQKAHSKKARLKAVCHETAEYYHLLLMRSTDDDANQAVSCLSIPWWNGTERVETWICSRKAPVGYPSSFSWFHRRGNGRGQCCGKKQQWHQ